MSSGQKNTATNTAQNAAFTGYNNQQQSYNSANQGYLQEYQNPGYSAAEKQAMTQATSGSLAGAFGASQQRLLDQAAQTGNTAGVNATEEELAREQGQQNAQALGALQAQFANARIQGTQNALGGESGLSSAEGNSANQAQKTALTGATTPGFWTRVGQGALTGLTSGLMGGRGCWIAEALYGIDTRPTQLLRWWLNDVWRRQSRSARCVMAAYRLFGRPAAFLVRRSRLLQAALRPLFDRALLRATAEQARRAVR